MPSSNSASWAFPLQVILSPPSTLLFHQEGFPSCIHTKIIGSHPISLYAFLCDTPLRLLYVVWLYLSVDLVQVCLQIDTFSYRHDSLIVSRHQGKHIGSSGGSLLLSDTSVPLVPLTCVPRHDTQVTRLRSINRHTFTSFLITTSSGSTILCSRSRCKG